MCLPLVRVPACAVSIAAGRGGPRPEGEVRASGRLAHLGVTGPAGRVRSSPEIIGLASATVK
ncbi:hypothetical protein GCM10019016_098870 [Streptomyces prasinosporus]|uniref:Uncharacterized protein n=1 Tax=Streptomyces prasinosporus TaxID=68256 RepID=A0ABP6U7R8_9ACTN